MKSIIAILEARGVNPAKPHGNSHTAIAIDNEPFMKLCIEHIGVGPHGLPAWSVAHYGEQNGDAMRDPEICFQITNLGTWIPYYFRNDYAGIEQCVYTDPKTGDPLYQFGGVAIADMPELPRVNERMLNDVRSFSDLWSDNLNDQGFIEAAAKTEVPHA